MNNTYRCDVIAIDGGAAGKSSTAATSRKIKFYACRYRCTLSYPYSSSTTIRAAPEQTAEIATYLKHLNLGTELCGQSALLSINNKSPIMKVTPVINASVSLFAALPDIRKFLFDYQRGQLLVAAKYGYKGVVMEGRDIGTTIFQMLGFGSS